MTDRFERFSLAISEISRHWHKLTGQEMENYGLRGPHSIYLLTMYRHPEGLTALELGELCGKDKADVSRTTAAMEKQGLIRKEGKQRYRDTLILTEKGKQAAEAIEQRAALAVDIAGQDLPEDRREAFYLDLERIAHNLRELSKQGLPQSIPHRKEILPMNKTRIVVDSTANLSKELQDKVTVVPLTVSFGEESYIDGVTISPEEFYEKLVSSDVLPTTSQATPAAFEEVFDSIVADGDSAVVLTLASKLSGTYQSATIAADKYPDNIFVVDTKSVAMGSGILAECALALAEQGVSARDIAATLNEEREHVRVVAMVDTLEYLKRGGRISKTVAFAGGLLNLKPLIAVVDGEITTLGKARGAKQAFAMLNDEIAKTLDNDKPILLGYTGVSDDNLQAYIAGNDLFPHPRYTVLCSVIGTHVGPGAVAVAYFAK